MTAEQRRLEQLISDILTAIDRITEYVATADESRFLSTPLVQDAVIRNLEVIGEAGRIIATRFPAFADANPDIAPSDAYGMRNLLAHGYFRIDLSIVWKTIKNDLPRMRALLAQRMGAIK